MRLLVSFARGTVHRSYLSGIVRNDGAKQGVPAALHASMAEARIRHPCSHVQQDPSLVCTDNSGLWRRA